MERTLSGIAVLDKSVAVLDAVAGGARSLAEIGADTGLPRATVHRLAVALERHGFLSRDAGGRFAPGRRVAAVDLAGAAAPALAALRDATGESAQLYVARGDQRVCILAVDSAHSLRTIVAAGTVLPIGIGSAGRVLAGERAPKGWIASVEEREPGVASVSAPVLDRGHVVAAVSVSGPVERMTRQPGRRFGAAVAHAAAEVTRALVAP